MPQRVCVFSSVLHPLVLLLFAYHCWLSRCACPGLLRRLCCRFVTRFGFQRTRPDRFGDGVALATSVWHASLPFHLSGRPQGHHCSPLHHCSARGAGRRVWESAPTHASEHSAATHHNVISSHSSGAARHAQAECRRHGRGGRCCCTLPRQRRGQHRHRSDRARTALSVRGRRTRQHRRRDTREAHRAHSRQIRR